MNSKHNEYDIDDPLKAAAGILNDNRKDMRSLLYKEILLNSLKCKRDELDILDLKIINRAMAEFRYAASVFKPYRGKRKVSIFGSARVESDDPSYQSAVAVSKALVDNGFMVITGAAEGIMRAGIEGAGAENSFGVNILLPFEKGPNALLRDDPKVVQFKYFFTRKIFFVMEADAFILFPGGYGTHDEAFEVFTLLQTGKALPMPVVLMEQPGDDYWETWDQFFRRQLLTRRLISPEDLSIYRIAHSPEEAVNWINSFYSTFHSARQVRDRLVIQLERELHDTEIDSLNTNFADIVEAGKIERVPCPDEEKKGDTACKRHRIAFRNNQKSAGRLIEMVLAINGMQSAKTD